MPVTAARPNSNGVERGSRGGDAVKALGSAMTFITRPFDTRVATAAERVRRYITAFPRLAVTVGFRFRARDAVDAGGRRCQAAQPPKCRIESLVEPANACPRSVSVDGT